MIPRGVKVLCFNIVLSWKIIEKANVEYFMPSPSTSLVLILSKQYDISGGPISYILWLAQHIWPIHACVIYVCMYVCIYVCVCVTFPVCSKCNITCLRCIFVCIVCVSMRAYVHILQLYMYKFVKHICINVWLLSYSVLHWIYFTDDYGSKFHHRSYCGVGSDFDLDFTLIYLLPD